MIKEGEKRAMGVTGNRADGGGWGGRLKSAGPMREGGGWGIDGSR